MLILSSVFFWEIEREDTETACRERREGGKEGKVVFFCFFLFLDRLRDVDDCMGYLWCFL